MVNARPPFSSVCDLPVAGTTLAKLLIFCCALPIEPSSLALIFHRTVALLPLSSNAGFGAANFAFASLGVARIGVEVNHCHHRIYPSPKPHNGAVLLSIRRAGPAGGDGNFASAGCTHLLGVR